jgi:hypothetical protein
MADRNIKVLTPATSFQLLTLDEAKLMLGMSTNDTSSDQQIQLFIDIASATVMRLCNRIFAYEEIRESWRELNGGHRIFPSHWPIKEVDIESVESPPGNVLAPGDYELEEGSGKISTFTSGFTEPVVVHYWGGYNLPDDAPLPLKRGAGLLVWQEKLQATLGTVGGVRMLSHKDSRVQFHDPLKILTAALGSAGSPIQTSVMNILSHYIHYEV